jgi:hypothetical protein
MFASLNQLKPKTKNQILGCTFLAATVINPEAFKALLAVCVVWSLLYVVGE